VKQWRLGYQDTFWLMVAGVDYEGAAVDTLATLHAFTPMVGFQPWGPGRLNIGLRYRFAFAHDERRGAETTDTDRFSATADWLF
jgi:hypothetical protein